MKATAASRGLKLKDFIAAALRKQHLGITEHQTDEFLSFTAGFSFQPATRDLIIEANGLRRHHGLPHWDSSILAAARANGCRILYSEDLQDGFSLGSLTILNPFRHL